MDWMSFAGPVPPEGARPIPKGEMELAWKRLRPQLEFSDGVAPPAPPPLPLLTDRRGRWRIPAWLPQTLAAVFFVTTIGLGMQVAKLRSVSSQGQPGLQANVGVTDETRYLEGYVPPAKTTGTRRGGEERRRWGSDPDLSVGQEHHLGFPLPEGTQPFASYRLEVVGSPGGRRFWSTETRELVAGMEGSGEGLTLRIKPGALPPGRYTAKAYGLDPGKPEEPIASYPFKMTQ
jgi:hypothetical protein